MSFLEEYRAEPGCRDYCFRKSWTAKTIFIFLGALGFLVWLSAPSKAQQLNRCASSGLDTPAVANFYETPGCKSEVSLPISKSNKSSLIIVEFTDYQCPFCKEASLTLHKLLEMYPAQIELRIKHFPLSSHADSLLAHEAALAAGEQGKFWEMHELLFENQRHLQPQDLVSYAIRLGLDKDSFVRAIGTRKFSSMIEQDIAEGKKLGVYGTPTFFVNGKRLGGSVPLETFRTVVDEEFKRQQAVQATLDGEDPLSRGPQSAPVVIRLFADFRSPVSANAESTLRLILPLYSGKVRLVFKNFPLPNHPDAMLAHEVAVAAAEQGRFWEIEERLFQDQSDITPTKIIEYCHQLGLDDRKFAQAVRDHKYRATVDKDIQEGKSLDVRGVPTIFINKTQIDGLISFTTLRALIDKEIARSQLGDEMIF